jgi:hypothetical protein
MYRWAQKNLVPADMHYGRVSQILKKHSSWFDGCIGAIDVTQKWRLTTKPKLTLFIGKEKHQ